MYGGPALLDDSAEFAFSKFGMNKMETGHNLMVSCRPSRNLGVRPDFAKRANAVLKRRRGGWSGCPSAHGTTPRPLEAAPVTVSDASAPPAPLIAVTVYIRHFGLYSTMNGAKFNSAVSVSFW